MKMFPPCYLFAFVCLIKMKSNFYQEEEEVVSSSLFVHTSAIRGLAHSLQKTNIVKYLEGINYRPSLKATLVHSYDRPSGISGV